MFAVCEREDELYAQSEDVTHGERRDWIGGNEAFAERAKLEGRYDDSTRLGSSELGVSGELREEGILCLKEESDRGLCSAYYLKKVSNQWQKNPQQQLPSETWDGFDVPSSAQPDEW